MRERKKIKGFFRLFFFNGRYGSTHVLENRVSFYKAPPDDSVHRFLD